MQTVFKYGIIKTDQVQKKKKENGEYKERKENAFRDGQTQIRTSKILQSVSLWVLSRGSSQPRDQTCVSCIAGGFLPLSHQGHLLYYFRKLQSKTT